MQNLTVDQQLRIAAVQQAVELNKGYSNATARLKESFEAIYEFLSDVPTQQPQGRHERPASSPVDQWVNDLIGHVGEWAKEFGKRPDSPGRY